MSDTFKIKRTRKAGVKPNINHFPDSETAIWNQADGKLWGLRIDDEGNKSVVLIGGGINTIGEVHARLHSIDSENDHAPAPAEHWGKYVRAEPGTGKIIFDNLPLTGVAIVLVEGLAGYIEVHQHNLGADIQVDFYHVYLDGEETKRKLVEIHYDINSVGRIYWESSFQMSSHIAVIK
jgi:hypothetical protein